MSDKPQKSNEELLAIIQQLEDQRQQEKQQYEREKQQYEHEKQQRDERERQLQHEKQQLEAKYRLVNTEYQKLKEHTDPRDLDGYLGDNHFIFSNLRIASKSLCSTGLGTSVHNRRYPMHLEHWDGFENLQHTHLATIRRVLGDKRVFPGANVTLEGTKPAWRRPMALEEDIGFFERFVVEAPVQMILDAVLADPDVQREHNATSVLFTNNIRELQLSENVGTDSADESGPRSKKRVATEENTDRMSYPDGLGYRTSLLGEESVAFVFDYKAAHKFTVDNAKRALLLEQPDASQPATRKTLFADVLRKMAETKTTTDKAERELINGDLRVAMTLTQVYDYMITRGVEYGYATAGQVIVFLHVDLDDVKTLYYHLCLPQESVGDVGAASDGKALDLSQTAVAQLSSFCLIALGATPRLGTVLVAAQTDTQVKRWPEAYDDLGDDMPDSQQTGTPSQSSQESDVSLYEEPTRKSKKQGGCKEPDGLPRQEEDDERDRDGGPRRVLPNRPGVAGRDSRTTRATTSADAGKGKKKGNASNDGHECKPALPYCTQACLLGLKRGHVLDKNCPNVALHQKAKGGSGHHPIRADEFTALVRAQLHRSVYRHCFAIDPWGFKGKIGRIGALFKLELAPYGYTFVAKGTQAAHLHHLEHESAIYARLESLQGTAVPVHLGLVDLPKPLGYMMPGGALVLYMMLMAWGGELALDAVEASEVSEFDMMAEETRTVRELSSAGIVHNDLRVPNCLWNKERQRVMIIDFDTATFRAPAKNKRVAVLAGTDHNKSKSKSKRKRKDDAAKHDGKRTRLSE